MYSSRLLKLINVHCKVCYFWGSCSLRLGKNSTFYIVSDARYRMIFFLTVILTYTGLFLPGQIYKYRAPQYFDDFNLVVVICLASTLGDLLYAFVFFEDQLICTLANLALRFLEKYQGNYPNILGLKNI